MGAALASSMRGKLAVISPFKSIRFSDPHILQAMIFPQLLARPGWNTPFGRDCIIVQCPLVELTVFCFSDSPKNPPDAHFLGRKLEGMWLCFQNSD
jgi:hypothetical protein